ncbi:hypothetical protein Tco_0499529 [Tanacetum coccineum]
MSDTESDDIIQRKESKNKATKNARVKKQADKKKKRKSTESESDSDFEVGTFDKYNRVESKKKGKRPAVEKNSDSEDALCAKKKRKGNKQEYNMIVAYKAEAEATDKRLKEMGFGDFEGNFDFYYVPGILALWVVKNFNPKTCTLVMEDGSMIKITRDLIHDMLGIPMGDIKVESLKEKNLFDPVTAKWRGMVQEIVSHDNKINISQLESFLCTLSDADWLFDIGFLSLFFSIFGQGNKDGTINERLIPYLEETDKIHQMDWCSYVLDSLVKECTSFSTSDKFSGPVLLLVLIYVNSTVSEKIKVEKTVPAFKAWSSNLILKRQQEELDLKGFGLLPIVKGLEFIEPKKEMKKILKDNLLKGRNLMEDTDNKLDIALAINSDDEELKNIIEKRNKLFNTLYKDNEELRNIIEKKNEVFVTLYKDKDLEKDDDDEETDGDDDDDAPDGDNDDKDDDETDGHNDDKDDDETDGHNDDKDDDEKDENTDKNDDKTDEDEDDGDEKDNHDETNGDNDDIDEDDGDENIRNEKEKKNVDEGNKEEAGSENVKDDKVEEKDENVEEEKEKNKLESKKISDPSLVVHQMIEDMTKLPLISRALKEVAHGVPPVEARPSFNKLMFKLKQDSDGKVYAKKIDDVPCSEDKGFVNSVEINAKVAVKRSAKAVDVPPDKVIDAAKKKLAAMTQFKHPRPATKIIKDDYQTPKKEERDVSDYAFDVLAFKLSFNRMNEELNRMHEDPPHMFGNKKEVMRKRRTVFNENIKYILKEANKKIFNDVHLVFFPCIKLSEEEETRNHYYLICFNMMTAEIDIIDNIHNDLEDLDLRYGPYAMAL